MRHDRSQIMQRACVGYDEAVARHWINQVYEEGIMSTKDEALIENMLDAYFVNSGEAGRDLYSAMDAALAVARKAILEEAERAILDKTAKLYAHAKAPYIECAEVVRSLSTQEQHND